MTTTALPTTDLMQLQDRLRAALTQLRELRLSVSDIARAYAVLDAAKAPTTLCESTYSTAATLTMTKAALATAICSLHDMDELLADTLPDLNGPGGPAGMSAPASSIGVAAESGHALR